MCEVIKKRSCILSLKLSEVCVVFYEMLQNDVKKPKLFITLRYVACVTEKFSVWQKNEWFNKRVDKSEINVNSVDFATLLVVAYMEIFIPSWNFNFVYGVEKNSNYIKNLIPGWNIIVSSKYKI